MNIVVTGAGGFIGSYAVRAISEEGYKVYALYHNNPVYSNEHVQGVQVDLLNETGFDVLADLQPNLVIHCAALLPTSFEDTTSMEAAKKNKIIDQKIIDIGIQQKCRIVFLSSTSVYGLKNHYCHEKSPLDPCGDYPKAKMETEMELMKSNANAVILRCSAPYGPGQRIRTVLQIFVERALRNENLKYFGSGKREQDFTFVEDIARAIVKAAFNLDASGIFNVASGEPVTMKNLAKMVIDAIPKCTSKTVSAGIPDPQENYRANYDISKAASILGWRPEVSLETGIATIVEHLRQN